MRVFGIPGLNQPPVRCEQQFLIRLAHRRPLGGNDTGNRLSAHAALYGDLAHGKLHRLIQLQNKGGTFSVGHSILPEVGYEEARLSQSGGTGHRVLYHIQAQGKLLVQPLFQFRIAATEVSGIVSNPAALSRLFTNRLAFLS
ncbi:MAG: hypothetical protein A2X82_02330 [Geobacteraceae bacterium GWC2_55_20]|nr:MAG: hypothetical protein A2X82_02330 [Geobacteraceae bacterium GWC2_55_20]OGU20233.1 MAG: hypothetical protein A2X85_06780 [Geobacteraceae bacterium GWF2_54_21]HBA72252.1 hypothetical protein [Geobacter sp.]HCE67637.1 hypothetical protein [Geobacter sp.]